MSDEDKRKTWKGLRPEGDCPTLNVSNSEEFARNADATASAKEEAKWQALFDSGLVNLESIPEPREEVKWSGCDDLEVRVLLRAKGRASIGAMLDDATYSKTLIKNAICRLMSRGLLRFP